MSHRRWLLTWMTTCGLVLFSACVPDSDDDDDSQAGAGGEGTTGGSSGAGGGQPTGGAGDSGEAGSNAAGGNAGSHPVGANGGMDGGGSGGGGEGGTGGSEECPPNSKLDSPRVQWLGACTPTDVSDDGSVALAREGLWRADSGWTELPQLDADGTNLPLLLSGDGNVVFGCSRSESGSELYRWTAEAGITGLGEACPGESGEYADTLGSNAQGTTLISCGFAGDSVLLRWTPEDGVVPVDGAIPGEVCLYNSASLSSNGATLAADSSLYLDPGILYIESSTTVTLLRPLMITRAMVSAISGDGRVVATYYKPATHDNGSSIDADLCLFLSCPRPSLTVMTSLNHDGSAGIGVQEPDPDIFAPNLLPQFHWTSSEGMRHLSDAFFEHEVYVDVGTGPAQSVLSNDGTSVLGVGTRHHIDGSSTEECFLAEFGPARELVPAMLPVLGTACGNGTVDAGEACDDGNQNDSDACTSRCELLALASGPTQTCWIQDGRVACWGEPPVTPGEGSNAWSPTFVTGIDDARQVAVRASHACALRAGGIISCWGDNSFGELGDGTTMPSAVPVNVVGITSAVGVAVGDSHSCALIADGTVQCWGDNSSSQLGGATNLSSPVPVAVNGLDAVTQLVAGDVYSCALLADRSVRCWGGYNVGVTTVPGLANVRTMSAGSDIYVCGLLFDGALQCWEGGETVATFSPYGAPPADPMQVAVTGYDWQGQQASVCILTANGAVACSGANASGQLGSGDRQAQRLAFQPVYGIQDAVEISAGGRHVCARSASGEVNCWGNNEAGQLGIGFKHANSPFGLAKPATVALCP